MPWAFPQDAKYFDLVLANPPWRESHRHHEDFHADEIAQRSIPPRTLQQSASDCFRLQQTAAVCAAFPRTLLQTASDCVTFPRTLLQTAVALSLSLSLLLLSLFYSI